MRENKETGGSACSKIREQPAPLIRVLENGNVSKILTQNGKKGIDFLGGQQGEKPLHLPINATSKPDQKNTVHVMVYFGIAEQSASEFHSIGFTQIDTLFNDRNSILLTHKSSDISTK